MLYPPSRGSKEYIYGSNIHGACGLRIMAEDSDIFLVDTAFKLLTSSDAVVRNIAEKEIEALSQQE